MVIDVGGVGYEVEAPLSVFYDLPELGQAIVILTHHLGQGRQPDPVWIFQRG